MIEVYTEIFGLKYGDTFSPMHLVFTNLLP